MPFWLLLISGVTLLGLVLLIPWPLGIHLRAGWGADRPPRLHVEAAVWGRRVWTGGLPPPGVGQRRRRALAGRGGRGLGAQLIARLVRLQDGPGSAAAARAVLPAARYLRQHMRVLYLKWHTRVGLREAGLCALAATALQVGQSAVGLALSAGRPASPLDLRVWPDYRWAGLETVLDCRLRVSPLWVLLAGLRALVAVRFAATAEGRSDGDDRIRAGHRAHAKDGRSLMVPSAREGVGGCGRTSHCHPDEDGHGEHPPDGERGHGGG